jgi:endonuclease/exonuclease/phosphatase family metal-dependent hydrolase
VTGALLVRSWNVFHGNAATPRRKGFLHEMVALAAEDGPDVLCLQELPAWSLPLLHTWTGMHTDGAVARPPFWPAPFSAWLTRRHQGFFRSGLAGQANAILTRPEHESEDLGKEQISTGKVERRVCQAVRVAGRLVVANLHATNELRRPEIPTAEVERARKFAEAHARPGEPVVLAGDFNVLSPRLPGYSEAGPGIDHVLVRGAPSTGMSVWPPERRTVGGVLLSDHAPVEARVG